MSAAPSVNPHPIMKRGRRFSGSRVAISRAMGTAPVAHREKLDLTDEEFALVSSDIPPIVPRFQTYVEFGDWMEEAWTEMITS